MRLAVTSAVLFGVWLVLSGTLAPLYAVVGLVSATAAAMNMRPVADSTRVRPLRILAFIPWLAWQVLRSNLRVARMVLSVRMPIRPAFIHQPPGVRGPRALTMLGTAMTLTPGTLTVDVTEDEIFVHALDAVSAKDVREGVIARRVARMFEERA